MRVSLLRRGKRSSIHRMQSTRIEHSQMLDFSLSQASRVTCS